MLLSQTTKSSFNNNESVNTTSIIKKLLVATLIVLVIILLVLLIRNIVKSQNDIYEYTFDENQLTINLNHKSTIIINIKEAQRDVKSLGAYIIRENDYKFKWISSMIQILAYKIEEHQKASIIVDKLEKNKINIDELFFDMVCSGMNNIDKFLETLMKSFETSKMDQNKGTNYYPGHKGRQLVKCALEKVYRKDLTMGNKDTNQLLKTLRDSIDKQPVL